MTGLFIGFLLFIISIASTIYAEEPYQKAMAGLMIFISTAIMIFSGSAG